MTNTRLLRIKIKNSGLKMSYIAEVLGISRCQLWKKIKNLCPFNQYEIQKLCKLLKIKTKREIEAIFFAKNVDNNDYNTKGSSCEKK